MAILDRCYLIESLNALIFLLSLQEKERKGLTTGVFREGSSLMNLSVASITPQGRKVGELGSSEFNVCVRCCIECWGLYIIYGLFLSLWDDY